LVQEDYIYPIGPAPAPTVANTGAPAASATDPGAGRIHFIRTPNHYLGARRDGAAGVINTSSLQPLQPSAPTEGQQTLVTERTLQRQRLHAANGLLNRMLGAAGSSLTPLESHRYRQRVTDETAAFNRADVQAYADVPPHLRGERRVSDLRAAAVNVEDMIVALAVEQPDLLVQFREILQNRRIVEFEFFRFLDRHPNLLQQFPEIMARHGAEILRYHPSLGGGPSSSGQS
jgi:hypothetical protein